MTTYVNPNAIKEHSVTSAHLADGVIPTDASIAAMGYTKNAGTVTGITMNGESQGAAGVVDLGNVVTGNAKIFYGTCATDAATVTKAVICKAFTAEDLVKGALVFVTFDKTNSGAVANLRLDVNSTGAKPIKKSYNNTDLSNLSFAGELKSNVTYLFTYDGTNWVCMTVDYNSNTTYSAMTQTEINAGSGTTGRIITPAILRANFYTETEVDSLLDAKADASAAIGSLNLAIDPNTYQITLSGTKADGSTFTVQNVIDLPLESVVVSGSYNSTTKKVVLTLQNGSTVEFSVADLVAGLQSEITSANKLSADLIQDGMTNKTVTATEKSTWNGKQDAIPDLSTIRYDATTGAAKISNVQADWDATTGLAEILNRPDWLLEKQENILNVNTDMAAYNPYSYNYIFNRIEGGYRFTRPNTAQNAITFGISDLYISESEIPATEELYIPIDNTTFSANDSSMHVFMDIVLNSGISLPASLLTDDKDLADIYGYIRLDFIYEHDQYNPVYAFRSKNLSTLYDGVSRYVTNCTVSFTKLSEQYENNIWRISEDSYTNEYNVALPIKQEYRKSFYDCSVLSIDNITIDLETDLSFRLIDGVTICINSDNEISGGRTLRLNVNDTGLHAIIDGRNRLVSYINSGTSILTYSETSNKWVYVSDMPLVESGFLYIRKNGQNIIGKSYYDSTVEMSFNANIEDDIVYDISVNELPDVSTADNGKIMMVVNGQWSMVEPVAIYSGDGDPSNNLGKNGDLYLQTGK